jgi:hypothetical protein
VVIINGQEYYNHLKKWLDWKKQQVFTSCILEKEILVNTEVVMFEGTGSNKA